ncbi:MAG: SCO family protein [Bacteroidia bacterium]
MKTGKTEYKNLPVYGSQTFDPNTRDSISHKVPPFSLKNTSGHPFKSEELNGSVYVVSLHPVHCDDTCRKVQEQLLRVQNSYTHIENVMIVSLFPKDGSASGSENFALQNEIDTQRWKLLTANSDEINDLWEQGYLQEEAAHQNLVLTDQYGRIRGIYDGTQREEGKRLMDEINLLLRMDGK